MSLGFLSATKVITLSVTTAKNAYESSFIIKVIVLFLAYMEPIRNMYHVVAVSIAINFLVGIWKSKKTCREKFNTKKAWRTIEKTGLFTLYIMIIYFFEIEILKSPEIYVSRALCGILIVSECKSIGENGDAILGSDLFSTFFKTLSSAFNKKATRL